MYNPYMETTTQPTQKNHNQSQQKSGLHPVILRLFEKRGMSQDEIVEFLSWDLKNLPELTEMMGMDEAADRILKAIENHEHIGIYGDYDVDGTTSCALFWHFFDMIGFKVSLIQPSRFIEGYGLHASSIDKAVDDGINLLITVDCGITNNEAADYAKEKGLDLIITDHHKDARDEMPNALAVVNPNRRDEPEDSPLRPLAGVGVAFAVCWEVRKRLENKGQSIPSLYPLLQFVAVGTICDLAKLTPMNLKLVRHGLKQIPQTQYAGIRAFFSPEERKQKMIPSEKLSFNVGPLINSKGRLDHPEKALNLLISSDSTEAYENYSHLEVSNKERKFIQAEVFQSAKEQYLKTFDGSDPIVAIVYQEDWHEGVIGIVASKLVESFKVPAIVFTNAEQEGIIKASARSAGDLNIFNLLQECSDLFAKFGGHKAAAGLSMPKENLPLFREKMEGLLREIPLIERTKGEHYDLEIAPQEINPKLVKELDLLEPFGMGNEKPIFKMKGIKLTNYDLLKDVHVRWSFAPKDPAIKMPPLKGISFNYIGSFNKAHPQEIFTRQNNEEITAYFTLGINRFNGNEYIQLMVDRITIDEI
ncbi:MAG: single-stranded-DNA-specific exonuclease RecJ [Halobacteriovoraceae bacterium]|nr:single-stranded-DNA-specific exonuclease RecJ [Halobacteriovoraceae bacterium]